MPAGALSVPLHLVQVHEKSILLPLMPLTLLATTEPDSAIWGPVVGAFSMYPLLVRDGVSMAYIATICFYILVMTAIVPEKGVQAVTVRNRTAAWLAAAACAGAVVLHLLQLIVPPPENLPWLHDRLFITYGFCFIAAEMLYLNYRQWVQQVSGSSNKVKQA